MKMSHQKSNDECQNESERGAEQKHQKLYENETETAIAATTAASTAAAAPKSITNICYDCLERIFDFLDLESLLNVAGTCKRLQIAAADKFGHDFDKSCVALYPFYPNDGLQPLIRKYEDEIRVGGLKFCFPILRCFGGKISNLKYFNTYARTRNDNLERYISQYCADTLTRIGISKHTAFPIGCFAKPFKNVVEVRISHTDLENYLPKFVDWFQNMRHLTLELIQFDEAAIAVHFPQLKELFLFGLGSSRNSWTCENVAKLLHANLQLQSLAITSFAALTLDEVLNMISKNSSILDLGVWSNLVNVNAVELNRFASERPLMEKLIFHRCLLTADDAIMFIRQLNALKFFWFYVKDQPECDRFLNQLDSKWKCRQHRKHDSQKIKIKLNQ